MPDSIWSFRWSLSVSSIKTAATQGKKVSALVRESIEEKLAGRNESYFEEKMREAYLEMAQENLDTEEEFRYADAENL